MFKLSKNSQKVLFHSELTLKRSQQILTMHDYQNITDDVRMFARTSDSSQKMNSAGGRKQKKNYFKAEHLTEH